VSGKVRVTKLTDVAERRVNVETGKSEVHVTLPPVDLNSPS
jgi:tRNA(Ser,Leu) C12 N-acetylase TAN1